MIGNTQTAWGSAARIFHWIGAALILFLVVHGGWMTEFPPCEARFVHYSRHASLGYGLLLLVILRLVWRLTTAVPELPAGMARWERIAAHVSHGGLYVLMLVAAVSGWALAGTFRRPFDTTFFGLVRVPGIVATQDRGLHEQLEGMHGVFAWALAVLAIAHVVGAFYHLFVKKDGVMQRMLPVGIRR